MTDEAKMRIALFYIKEEHGYGLPAHTLKIIDDALGIKPKKFKCPIDYKGCTKFCGSYGCGG